MMRLKHLFNNEALPLMIINNWEHDSDSIELFEYFRISSNAIYPFKNKDQLRFLRIAPADEKDLLSLKGEIKFLNYLSNENQNVAKVVVSKNNNQVETVHTPWGDYYAVVFEGIRGENLEELDYSEDMGCRCGKLLGRIHKLSSRYLETESTRPDIFQRLEWIQEVLEKERPHVAALNECRELMKLFKKRPQNKLNFGLIHYDFELDNLIYNEKTESLYVIDFDDAMYGFYGMDVERALASIKEEKGDQGYSILEESFLNGYKQEYELEEHFKSTRILYERFANLYSYARISRSIRECWNNEPEWLIHLRIKLENKLKEKESKFHVN